MAAEKLGYEDFITTVDAGCVDMVRELHKMFTDAGCKLEVKEAKNGYVVSYLLNKKTVANYVFRKKGLIIRLYANHIVQYMDLLNALPESVKNDMKKAPDCKRLLNSAACNSKCPMGYDFLIGGERQQKCRYSAFMFLMCPENEPHIKELVRRELEACG